MKVGVIFRDNLSVSRGVAFEDEDTRYDEDEGVDGEEDSNGSKDGHQVFAPSQLVAQRQVEVFLPQIICR